jgi:S-DNA-T family DNA segregation ATPase FtsK/SpoIIIE
MVSLGSYHPSEEPTISANVQVENTMGIMGVLLSHLLIKLGFGFSSIIIPFLGIAWGWTLFSKQDATKLIRSTAYALGAMLLLSFTTGVFLIKLSKVAELDYTFAGLLGGILAGFFLDWFSIYGTILFLFAGWLMLIRGYFNLDYYHPFAALKVKWERWRKDQAIKIERQKKEKAKRRHTKDLRAKIDEKKEKEVLETAPASSKDDIESAADPGEIHHPLDTIEESSVDDIMKKSEPKQELENESHKDETDQGLVVEEEVSHGEIPETDLEDIQVGEVATTEEVNIDSVAERNKPRRKYQLPSSDLLFTPVNVSDHLSKDELVERANYLTQSLATYGVDGQVVNVHPGPIITLFEVEPAEGVRVNKFVALADDLARVMEASSVRVIAPIPGKSSVGIEIPNRNPATVFFKSVVNSPEFAEAKSLLTLAIGKTTSGEISTVNLGKMPHLLIAGTTGSGKSVCINTIICSLLYRATPDEVKFVMIDPKKVEMTLFRALEGYHLLKMEDIAEPIVTSVDNAILALRALEKEMDRRYNILAEAVVRNIDEYNEKMDRDGEDIMPYIVLVVDELADLMMLSAKDVEAPIARLAQLARAVGIHLVIATQRPSVDVITGVIKANFPSRIAFQVASKIDSRTIIDQTGADKLIGRGDMLYLGTGSSDAFRMHNAFLSLEEIEAIMNHILEQPKPEEIILPSVREAQITEFEGDGGGTDDMFNDAVSLVVTHQQGSISLLQRRLKVGYSRAARLIDEMEQAGIVGPFTGSKAREVLVDESYLEMIRD